MQEVRRLDPKFKTFKHTHSTISTTTSTGEGRGKELHPPAKFGSLDPCLQAPRVLLEATCSSLLYSDHSWRPRPFHAFSAPAPWLPGGVGQTKAARPDPRDAGGGSSAVAALNSVSRRLYTAYPLSQNSLIKDLPFCRQNAHSDALHASEWVGRRDLRQVKASRVVRDGAVGLPQT